jgi:signal transduction histidine kinase
MKQDLQSVIRFHKYHALLLFLLFIILIVAFTSLVIHQDAKYVAYDKEVRKRHFHEYKDLIDLKFTIVKDGLKQLKNAAEADLFESSKIAKFEMPFAYSLMKETDKGFDLDNIDGYKDKIAVSVTGNGPLKGRGRDFYRLIRMTLALNDDFASLQKSIPELRFIYHYSTKESYMQSPWEPSSVFRFDKGLYKYDNWKLALPEANPGKKLFWTEIYYDHGGKGLMTTCVAPIYDQNTFIGIIAVDLTVDFLNTIIKKFEPEKDGIMLITDQKNNLIAHPKISSFDKAVTRVNTGLPDSLKDSLTEINKSQKGKMIKINGWWVMRSKLSSAPFSLYYFEPCKSGIYALINRMKTGTFLIITAMVILVFASMVLTQRKIIRPSLAFVKFILAKSKGGDLKPDKTIPRIWQPWFSTIDNVFNENNQLTESIKQSNIVLENKNAELEREIEAKNKAEKEKEALEKQLIQEEKLKAIGLLSGGIAHDFNNQLAVIMGYASVLRSQVKLDDKKRNQCLDQILAAASSSSGLTKQLLAFAQKGKYQNVPVDVHKIITEVITILNHTIDKRISIKVDFEASHFTVKGDPAQIQNVVMNIAINAKNAMPNGGMITFRTTNVTLTEEDCAKSEFDIEPGNFIKISVVDTGSGITDENKKHIFEPFFTTNNSGHGNGLGLAAAMGAIKNHRGDISVDSAPGMGADFCIKLPVMSKNVKPKEPFTAYKLNVSISKSKLLLIDDETAFCRMLTDFMGALGYTIITYSDPLKAIEYYRDSWKEIDLVIVDMMMPKLSGHDVITEFEKVNNDVKFVISSGYSPEEVTQQLLQNDKHIKGFYKKPFDVVKFSNEIAYLLTQKD